MKELVFGIYIKHINKDKRVEIKNDDFNKLCCADLIIGGRNVANTNYGFLSVHHGDLPFRLYNLDTR